MKLEPTLESPAGTDRPPLLPWLGLLFVAAAAIGAYFLIAPALDSGSYYRSVLNRLTYGYSRQILLMFVPYALVLWAWRRGARAPLPLMLGGAVALHLIFLFAPLPQSQDFYQYLFYGRMQAAHAANPYVVHPSVYYADSWYGMIRWPNQTSVYGPVWTLLSYGVAKASGGSFTQAVIGMKLAIFSMDLAVMGSILSLAKGRRDPEGAAGWGLLVYAWNPLILITVPLGGLADAAIATGFLTAMVARRRGRTGLTTLLLTLATLVKVYAGIGLVLHLVLLARERDRRAAARQAAVAAGIAAVTFAPYWAGWQTFRGLLNVANLANKSLTGTLQRLLAAVLHGAGVDAAANDAAAVIRWLVVPLLALAVVWAIRRTREDGDLWYGSLIVLSVYLVLTPWFLYWYMVAPLALIAVLPRNRVTYPLLTFSATTLVTVGFAPWLLANVVQTVLRYGPPILVHRLQPASGDVRPRRPRPAEPALARPETGRSQEEVAAVTPGPSA